VTSDARSRFAAYAQAACDCRPDRVCRFCRRFGVTLPPLCADCGELAARPESKTARRCLECRFREQEPATEKSHRMTEATTAAIEILTRCPAV
jgi:hypothetical protein